MKAQVPEPAIEPIRRAFSVLQALNRRRSTTLVVLAAETGQPRPTVVRLLHTLIALGYASRVSREAGYRLTDQVLALAGGVRFIDHLVDDAMPVVGTMQRRFRAPGTGEARNSRPSRPPAMRTNSAARCSRCAAAALPWPGCRFRSGRPRNRPQRSCALCHRRRRLRSCCRRDAARTR